MPFFARPNAFRLALLVLAVLSPRVSFPQIATGSLTGKLRDPERQPVRATIIISSELGFRAKRL